MDLLGPFLPLGECHLKIATPGSHQEPVLFYRDGDGALRIKHLWTCLRGRGHCGVTPCCWSSLKNRGYLKMSKGEITSVELRSVEQTRTLPPAHCGGWAFSSLDDTCPCCVYPLDPVTSLFQRSARALFASGRTPAGCLPWRMGRPRYRWSLAGRGSAVLSSLFGLGSPSSCLSITVTALRHLDAASCCRPSRGSGAEWCWVLPEVTFGHMGFQHFQTFLASFWHFLLNTSRDVSARSSILYCLFTPQILTSRSAALPSSLLLTGMLWSAQRGAASAGWALAAGRFPAHA